MTDWVLAIDYGTSFSSAAIRRDGAAALVKMHAPEGLRDTMPSSVFWPTDGELVVGWVAENQAALAPDRFEPAPKRRLGVDEHLLLGGEAVPVAEAVAAVLRRMFDEARRSRGDTWPSLVALTHPASWAEGRIEALGEAARLAGIESPHLLSEPEGAALHFATAHIGAHIDIGGLVAVYDLGGGTFDAAVLERVGEASFQLAGKPGGRDGLGGEEFDRKLYEHVARQLAFEEPDQWARIRANGRSHRDFRIEVRRAKEALSSYAAYDLVLPEAAARTSWRVTREEFESLIRPDIEASVDILARTLADAGIDDPTDASRLVTVYLAGGSSRIPLVAQAIGERLGRVPSSLDEPKIVVALGASNVERTAEAAAPVRAVEPAAAAPRPAAPESEPVAPAPSLPAPSPKPAPVRVAATPELEAPGRLPALVTQAARRRDVLALLGAACVVLGYFRSSGYDASWTLARRVDFGIWSIWSPLEAVVAVLLAAGSVFAHRRERLSREGADGLLLGVGAVVFFAMVAFVGSWLKLAGTSEWTAFGAVVIAAAGAAGLARQRGSEVALPRQVTPLTVAGIVLLLAPLVVDVASFGGTTLADLGRPYYIELLAGAVAAAVAGLTLVRAPHARLQAGGVLAAVGLLLSAHLIGLLVDVGHANGFGHIRLGGVLGIVGGLLLARAGTRIVRLAEPAQVAPPETAATPA